MEQIRQWAPEHVEYARDESRSTGVASSISFPASEGEVASILAELASRRPGEPVTVQGARTGLAGGAVPHGGHVLNLSRMDAYLGLSHGPGDNFLLRVQPGVVLSELRRHLRAKSIPSAGWDEESLAALEDLYGAPEHFFPTDPTEASACVGGMAACNASGARSYRYGAMRSHVNAIRVLLADGDALSLRRGQARARGRSMSLITESGREIDLRLPSYRMPHAKNASGYYVADDMDALDLFVGSDGTLGVITELELVLEPAPGIDWSVACFLPDEASAIKVVRAVREGLPFACAIEYFDGDALDLLRAARAGGGAIAAAPEPPCGACACVLVEFACDRMDVALEELDELGRIVAAAGGDADETWVAQTDVDRERMLLFRHAVPARANMLIDERRREDPSITKLGSDMSVPDDRLEEVMGLYRDGLAKEGLQSAVWGHIGDNHLHVNILPRDGGEHAAGKALFGAWAGAVTKMGGAVSAEHGVGKLKRDFLLTMYGDRHLDEMADLKVQLDPRGVLGRGNMFDEERLEAAMARAMGPEGWWR